MKRKLLSLLVLLITGVTGAWAQDTYTIVFTVESTNFTYANQTLPYTKKIEEMVPNASIYQSMGYSAEILSVSGGNIVKGADDGWDTEITINDVGIGSVSARVSKDDFKQDAIITITVKKNIPANAGDAADEYWATYYDGTTSYTADDNTTVYQAAVNGTKTGVVLTEVTGREIPAGKGVILKSTSSTIILTPATTTQTLEGNQLQGVDAATAAPANAYCLSKETTDKARGVGFYTFTGTIPAHRAYLVVTDGPSSARGFLGFGGDGNTTGIQLPEAVIIEGDGPIYDLSGRIITGQPQKGVYVKNGKKVVIK